MTLLEVLYIIEKQNGVFNHFENPYAYCNYNYYS